MTDWSIAEIALIAEIAHGLHTSCTQIAHKLQTNHLQIEHKLHISCTQIAHKMQKIA